MTKPLKILCKILKLRQKDFTNATTKEIMQAYRLKQLNNK